MRRQGSRGTHATARQELHSGTARAAHTARPGAAASCAQEGSSLAPKSPVGVTHCHPTATLTQTGGRGGACLQWKGQSFPTVCGLVQPLILSPRIRNRWARRGGLFRCEHRQSLLAENVSCLPCVSAHVQEELRAMYVTCIYGCRVCM